jgi:RNA polymerase sigma-70 factor (ECF subfamily)
MNTDTHDVAASLEFELEALWRFGLRLTGNADDAADLVQRTCVRALEQRDKYSAQGKFRSWLFQIQHRIWLNELRSRKIRAHDSIDTAASTVETASGQTYPLASDWSGESAQTQVYLQQVCDAVDKLPEAQRLVVLLVLVEECTYQEAADILNVPIGTVMSRLARARVAIGQLQIEHTSTETPAMSMTDVSIESRSTL